MVAFDFPASPVPGQAYQPPGGPGYVFDGERWRGAGAVTNPNPPPAFGVVVKFVADGAQLPSGAGAGTGTDATLAIQQAIDAASAQGGNHVIVPFTGTGIYRVDGTIQMKSNVTVVCDRGVKFDCEAVNLVRLQFLGTVDAEKFTATNLTRGDKAISTSAAHNLAVGDYAQIISQRNALSYVDAGPWCCGNGTTSLNYAYFSEWLRVAAVGSATTFTSVTALTFPDYRIDITLETDTARTRTTIRKVNPVINAHWIGGEWLYTTGTVTLMTGRYAVGCTVEDSIVRRGEATGPTIYWNASYECEGTRIQNFNAPSLVWDYVTMHSLYNRYKVISSQDCGFKDCYDEYSGQSFDLTYGIAAADYLLNVRPYVIDCTIRHAYEACTSHPGNYGERWVGNYFPDCTRNAIIVRGLQPIVANNTATSATELLADLGDGSGDFSVAFDFYNGHTRGLHAFGNSVTGFRYAFRVRDGTTEASRYTVVDGIIENNSISECYGGLNTWFLTTTPKADRRGLIYRDNTHRRMHRFAVNLDQYSCGCQVTGNTLHGDFLLGGGETSAYFTLAISNCPALTVTDNKWYRTSGGNAGKTIRMVSIGSIPDPTTYPEATFLRKTVVRNNIVDVAMANKYTYNNTPYLQIDYFSDSDTAANGLYTGFFTAVYTPVANVDSATHTSFMFMQVGNWVNCVGRVTIDCTATATASQVRVSLPIASDFTDSSEVAGVIAASALVSAGRVQADITNNEALIAFWSASAGAIIYDFNFSYRIK
jgi:hypothetical protein